MEARCDVTEPPAYLVPDMTVSLEIEVGRHDKVLTVPSERVRDASTAPWLLVARNGRAVKQVITLGVRGNGASEIKNGVKEGEQVLPETGVSPGDRVRVIPVVSGAGHAR